MTAYGPSRHFAASQQFLAGRKNGPALAAATLRRVGIFVFQCSLQVALKIIHFCLLRKFLGFPIDGVLYAEMSSDALENLQHLRDLLLRQQIDLKVKVAAMISTHTHSVLSDEHEGR